MPPHPPRYHQFMLSRSVIIYSFVHSAGLNQRRLFKHQNFKTEALLVRFVNFDHPLSENQPVRKSISKRHHLCSDRVSSQPQMWPYRVGAIRSLIVRNLCNDCPRFSMTGYKTVALSSFPARNNITQKDN